MKINVGVFFGGKSVEHEVSVISALQVINALDKEKYNVIPVYISKEGIFYSGNVLLDIENFKEIKTMLQKAERVVIVNEGAAYVLLKYNAILGKKVLANLDVAVPIMHGTYGEDGAIQGYFEMIGIPYTGCNVLASALGMDKIASKKILKAADLPIIDYMWFYSREWIQDAEAVMQKIENKLVYPVIVKPANLGSSVGVSKANNRDELEEAIELAKRFAHQIIVEKMVVQLKEINCSVIGDSEQVEATVCEEPIGSSEVLSYQDKYMKGSKGMGGSMRKMPAEIPTKLTAEIQDLAKRTFLALGCSGVARVDFLIDNDSNQVYVNEINTIPGSLAFYLWEATGKSFAKLMDDLVNIALKAKREKDELYFTFGSNLLSQSSIGGIKK